MVRMLVKYTCVHMDDNRNVDCVVGVERRDEEHAWTENKHV